MKYEYFVSFENPKSKKSYEDGYEYESTAKLYYEQMKEIASNVKLLKINDFGEKVVIEE